MPSPELPSTHTFVLLQGTTPFYPKLRRKACPWGELLFATLFSSIF